MKKNDVIYLLILTSLCILLIFGVILMGYQYGSSVDWFKQHVTFASQFRQNFYETGVLLPDINWNNGCGMNIYSISYYGLLNPIILLSYLLPFIPMNIYLMFSTMLSLIASFWIFYLLLIKHHFSYPLRMFLTLAYLLATPLLFHSHRQVMFINYLPFLMLGFLGVHLYFQKKKIALLALSIFLIAMTSYFYLISCIISLTLYGIYCFLEKYKKFEFPVFLRIGIPFALTIFLGALMAMVILLPTFYMLVNSGGKSSANLNFLTLLLPMNIGKSMLYGRYSMGLTGLSVVSVVYFALHKSTLSKRFLSISLLFVSCICPIMYLLNGTLYVRPKILIPFIPLAILLLGYFLMEERWKQFHLWDYLLFLAIAGITTYIHPFSALEFILILILFWQNQKILLYAASISTMFILTISGFAQESWIPSNKYESLLSQNYSKLVNSIPTEELARYRVDELSDANNTANAHSNSSQKKISVYSSSYNKIYNDFYYRILQNANSSNNNISVMASANPISNHLLSSKYLLTRNKTIPYGYECIDKKEGYSLLKSDHSRSIAYTSTALMSLTQFQKLDEISRLEALMQYHIVEYKKEDVPIYQSFKKINLQQLENYQIKQKSESTLRIPTESTSPVIYLSFDVIDHSGDGSIIAISGIRNKLSSADAPYFNHNNRFHFFITLKQSKQLSILFSPGNYGIKNVRLYEIEPAAIDAISKFDTPVHSLRVKNNKIQSLVNLKEDGLFATTIPFDKGFHAYVDGKEVDTQRINTAFVGIPVSHGQHQIRLVYIAPMKPIGLVLTILGWLIFFTTLFLQIERKPLDEKNNNKIS